MMSDQLSLILLPTNKCNVACEYCFEDKTADFMMHDQLAIAIAKVLDHMERSKFAGRLRVLQARSGFARDDFGHESRI